MATLNPEPGVNCPEPARLQTGDLLFPRKGGTAGKPAGGAELKAKFAGQKMKDRVEAYGAARGPVPTVDDQVYDEAPEAKSAFDPNDIGHLLLLVKILKATFADELEDWLDLTVEEFLRHPLAELMIGAMNQELGDGLFVGHVAMAFREPGMDPADDKSLFVIEANITDFSHYRVSIHPYFRSDELQLPPGSGRMRGWVNYRTRRGDKVWARRPRLLVGDSQAIADTKLAIVEEAKRLLGRPYGFFDSPQLGDIDRLYCSEFILAVLRAVAARPGLLKIGVEDRRTWKWLLDTVGTPKFRKDLVEQLKEPDKKGHVLYNKVIGRDFFLLTVHMLWSSAALLSGNETLFTPVGEGPYAADPPAPQATAQVK